MKKNGCYTNYNELMLKALRMSKELGISEMPEFMELVTKIFREDSAKRKANCDS